MKLSDWSVDKMKRNHRNSDKNATSSVAASFTLRTNFKIFARAVLTSNRIGDELYMEPCEYGLVLRSLNCSKSATSIFLFSKTFFSECDVSGIERDAYNICRLSMKCALSAFKCVKNSEKIIASCQLDLCPQGDTMLIQLTHIHDIKKSYQIPLIECNTTFKNVVDKADLKNCFIIQAKLLLELFNRMHNSTDEIVIDSRTEEIFFRNYITREQDRNTIMKTEGKISITEFQKYDIKNPTEITVNLKELKAIVSFADYYDATVSIYFDSPGIPMVIALEDNIDYTAEVILATAIDDVVIHNLDSQLPSQTRNVQHRQSQLRRERSQSPSKSLFAENLALNSVSTAKSNTSLSSAAKNNGAGKLLHQLEQTDSIIGPPQGYSSPISGSNTPKKTSDDVLLEGNTTVSDDNAEKNSRTNDDKDSYMEGPPSQGPALFRYLFAVGEPTFDEEEFFRDARVLAPDSESEEAYDDELVLGSDSEDICE